MFDIIKRRFNNIKYTALHWYEYQKMAYNLKVWHPRHILHDVDKIILYIFYEKVIVQNVHRRTAKHHIEFTEPTNLKPESIIDAIIDWECARLSKPDKPLTARETLNTLYPKYSYVFEPYLSKLSL